MNHKMLGFYLLSIFFTVGLIGYSPVTGLDFSWTSMIVSGFLMFSLTLLVSGIWQNILSILRIPESLSKYLAAIPLATFGTAILWIQIDYFLNTKFHRYSLTPGLSERVLLITT